MVSTSRLPGLALAAAVVIASLQLEKLVKATTPIVVSPLTIAVLIGALLANLRLLPAACRPGLQYGSRKLLRIGIVLLGLQLSFGDLRRLGGPGIVLVLVVVSITFTFTQWFGRRLGLSDGLSLLVATGFSICGASAIAAMRPVSDADDDDTAYAIALVTLCGSLAIVLLPVIARIIGFHDVRFGSWVGASVHDVAQTVATATTGGAAAKDAAVVVKLSRVILLAPMVAGVHVVRRRRAAANGGPVVSADPTAAPHPPIIPLFVAGFLAAIVCNSTFSIPGRVLVDAKQVEKMLLAGALVGLGAGVEIRRLRQIGHRPLVLGLVSWALIAVLAGVGVTVLHIG